MATTVIHIRDRQGTSDEVYIGRGSIWGNPFVIGRDGDRARVIALYKEYFLGNAELQAAVGGLVGKKLVCFCAPLDCHGDILAAAADSSC